MLSRNNVKSILNYSLCLVAGILFFTLISLVNSHKAFAAVNCANSDPSAIAYNVTIKVRILNNDGSFNRYSHDYNVTVTTLDHSSLHGRTPVPLTGTFAGIHLNGDATSVVQHDFPVKPGAFSTEECDIYGNGQVASTLIFGDSNDGRAYLGCNMDLWGDTVRHGLGFSFKINALNDLAGWERGGSWVSDSFIQGGNEFVNGGYFFNTPIDVNNINDNPTFQFKLPPTPGPVTSTVSASASAELKDDNENPDRVEFNSSIAYGGLGFDTTVTREFFIKRSATPTVEEPLSPDINDSSGFNTNKTFDTITIANILGGTYKLKVGDEICTRVTVSPSSATIDYRGGVSNLGGADSSGLKCDRYLNKPYVSFYGGDVKVGGGFQNVIGAPSCSNIPASSINAYVNSVTKGSGGSGSQFAAFALGVINGFSTASMTSGKLADGATNYTPNGLKAPSFLTYSSCIKDYFSGAPSGGPSAFNSAVNGAQNIDSSFASTATVNIGAGEKHYLYYTGDLTIEHDIIMATGGTDPSDLASFYLIVKGNIFIKNNVKRLDGMYIAQPRSYNAAASPPAFVDGTIDTCSDAGSDIFANCFNQLEVNGGFIAQKVNYNRTFGSLRDTLATPDNPYGANKSCSVKTSVPAIPNSKPVCAAEVFKFSPSMYLSEAPKPGPGGTDGSTDTSPFINTLPPVL